jgi:hypothetical protein
MYSAVSSPSSVASGSTPTSNGVLSVELRLAERDVAVLEHREDFGLLRRREAGHDLADTVRA